MPTGVNKSIFCPETFSIVGQVAQGQTGPSSLKLNWNGHGESQPKANQTLISSYEMLFMRSRVSG